MKLLRLVPERPNLNILSKRKIAVMFSCVVRDSNSTGLVRARLPVRVQIFANAAHDDIECRFSVGGALQFCIRTEQDNVPPIETGSGVPRLWLIQTSHLSGLWQMDHASALTINDLNL